MQTDMTIPDSPRAESVVLESDALLPRVGKDKRKGEIDDKEMLATLQALEDNELQIQQNGRSEMMEDMHFASGKQYSQEDLAALKERHQAPVVYNWVRHRLAWMTGTERRQRIDYKVEPRSDNDEAARDAETKTALLKYLSDTNYEPYHRSAAFEQASISGLSWIETGIRSDPDEEPLYTRQEHWYNVLHDSAFSEPDGSDQRFLSRLREVDLDVAQAYFPKHAASLRQSAFGQATGSLATKDLWYHGKPIDEFIEEQAALVVDYRNNTDSRLHSSWRNSTRERVKLRETWYYVPTREQGLHPGGSTFDRVKNRLWLLTWCDNCILSMGPSPYRHNQIPFTPVMIYREPDGTFAGLVRDMRDPSRAFNKKQSKAIFHLSARQIFMEGEAIDRKLMTLDQIRQEAARPDAVVTLAKDALAKRKIEIKDGRAMAAAESESSMTDLTYLRTGTGVNDDNLGNQTNATSGIAIERRQIEGSVATTKAFDNLALAQQVVGKQQLALIEQYYQAPKVFRITGPRNTVSWGKINQYNPTKDAYENDITKFDADYVLRQDDYRSTLAQAALTQLMQLLTDLAPAAPQLVMAMLDLIIEHSPLPFSLREALTARIREVTGATDPDEPPDENQVAQKEAQAQAEAAMQQRMSDAQIAEQEGKAALAQAKATQAQVDSVKKGIEAVKGAIESAGMTALTPQLMAVVDEYLASAGYVDQNAPDPNLAVPPQAQGTAPEAPLPAIDPDALPPGPDLP